MYATNLILTTSGMMKIGNAKGLNPNLVTLSHLSSPFLLTTTLQCIKATAPTVATEILIFTDTCLHICGQTWWQKLSGDSG